MFAAGYVIRVAAGLTVFDDVFRMKGQFLYDPVWALAGALITGQQASTDLSEGQPLFTLILAAMRIVSADNGAALLLMLSVFGAIACAFTYLICLEITGSRALSVISGAVMCLSPNQVRVDLLMFDQAMFAALYAGAVLLLVRYLKGLQPRTLLLFGFVLSLTYLTRATVQLFILVVALMLCIHRETSFRRLALASLLFVLPVALWGLRNYLSIGSFSVSDSDKWYLIYLGNNEMTDKFYPEYGVGILEPYARYRRDEHLKDKPQLKKLADKDPYVNDSVYRELLVSYVRDHPVNSAGMFIMKFLHFFSPFPIPKKGYLDLKHEGDEWVPVPSGTALSKYKTFVYFVTFTPVLIFSIIGAIVCMKTNRMITISLIAAVLTQALVTALVGASTRYTALVMPFLTVLGVIGAERALRLLLRYKNV